MSGFVGSINVVGGRSRLQTCSRRAQIRSRPAVMASVATSETAVEVDNSWREGKDLEWRGQKVKYCVVNEGAEGTPILLVHGFGASAEHWRFNFLELAESAGSRPVYGIDLLGFGRSDKPDIPEGFDNYGVSVWGTQVAEFIDDVIKRPVILAGNSLGGYSALYAASKFPTTVKALVLVNSAGPSESEVAKMVEKKKGQPAFIGRLLTYFGFLLLRREGRVRSVLNSVYTNNQKNVDDDLVNFILKAAFTEGAYEVYYRSTVGVTPGPGKDTMFRELVDDMPVGAVWGENDPWCTRARAMDCKEYLPRLQMDFIEAGHCPHDENPEAFNEAMTNFITRNDL